MSDEVEVPFGDNPSDQATLLLAAAEELGLGTAVVKTAEGAFLVPQEVHDKAFAEPEPKPAKKTTKKSTTRKKV